MRFLVLALLCIVATACNSKPTKARGGFTVTGAGCVFAATAAADGCTGAQSLYPSGGYPGLSVNQGRSTFFGTWNGSAYAGGSAQKYSQTYTTIPQRNVAGVDYTVGIPAGTVLKDPRPGGNCVGSQAGGACSGNATLPTGCSWSSDRIYCSGLSSCPDFNAIDLSVNGGTGIDITGSCTGTVQLRNSYWKYQSNNAIAVLYMEAGTGSVPVTLTSNYFDYAAGVGMPVNLNPSPDAIIHASAVLNATGLITSQYNAWMGNNGVRTIVTNDTPMLVQFDYYDGANMSNIPTHGELHFWAGSGTTSSWAVKYSTFYVSDTGSNGITALIYPTGASGGVVTSMPIQYNTFIVNLYKTTSSTASNVWTVTGISSYSMTSDGTTNDYKPHIYTATGAGYSGYTFTVNGAQTAKSGSLSTYYGGTGTYPIDNAATRGSQTMWFVTGGAGMWQTKANGSAITTLDMTGNFFDLTGAYSCYVDSGNNITNFTGSGNTDMTTGRTLTLTKNISAVPANSNCDSVHQ